MNKLKILLLYYQGKSLIDFNDVINRLQNINNDLSVNFRLYGTKNIDDVLNICFGNEYVNQNINEENKDLCEVIKKYTHPINYKILDWKDKNEKKEPKQKLAKNRIIEDFMLVETAATLDCFDLARTTKKISNKGLWNKNMFSKSSKKKNYDNFRCNRRYGYKLYELTYLYNKLTILNKNKPGDPDFLVADFTRFCNSLTLKELLVYSCQELYQRYMGYVNQTNLIKKKTISQIVKEFISNDLFAQRKTLIQLLMKDNDPEFQYLAYLLYDLLSNESNGNF